MHGRIGDDFSSSSIITCYKCWNEQIIVCALCGVCDVGWVCAPFALFQMFSVRVYLDSSQPIAMETFSCLVSRQFSRIKHPWIIIIMSYGLLAAYPHVSSESILIQILDFE